jgi:site-specific DNA recombinase
VLSNPIYSGRIAHKGQLYPGQHPALIDDVTWTAVRERIDANRAHRALTRAAEPSLLTGLLVDVRGERLTPSHAIKKSRRYRYYVSAALITGTAKDRGGWRLPAEQMEQAVLNTLTDALAPAGFVERFALAGIPGDQIRKVLGRAARVASALRGSPAERLKTIRDLVEQVVVSEEKISIKVRRSVLSGEDIALGTADDPGDSTIEVATAVAFPRRGRESRLVLPGSVQQKDGERYDPPLIKAIARGRAWFEELAAGRARSLQELAAREGINRRYIRRLINLAFLSPQLVEAIMQGRQPVELTVTRLTELDLPMDWAEQHSLLAS